MSECTSALIALAIITLILLVIYLGVSYAFETLENRSLREEINNGFHYTAGFNESLAKDKKILEDELRPYKRLANKYRCQDAEELEKLLMDLQDNIGGKVISLLRIENPGKSIAENIEKKMKSGFCHCCFFGHVRGEIMGEPLCAECAKNLYGFDADEECPSIKKNDPYYQLWYRRQKALPIFEAYLQAELERYKLEQKLEEKTND